MKHGLYLPDGSFMRFADTTSGSLSSEIAVRHRSLDYYAIGSMYLPNPDPVLKAQGRDIDVYNDLLIDDRVGGGMINRINATLSLDWEIDKGKGSKSRQAKAVKAIFDRLQVSRITEELIRGARGFGYAPHEIVWGTADGLTVPLDLVAKPQRWFVFGQDNDLRFRSRDHLLDGEELPPRKFICPTNEAAYDNPYGLGLLSRCFWPVVFKKGGWRFWVQFSEKFGQVWPIGKLPRSATPEMRSDLLEVLSAMVADGVAVIPDDGGVDFKESGSKGATSDLYRGIIAEANSAISTVWLGHAAAGESVTGKLGGDTAATDVRDDLRDSDKTLVEAFFNTVIDYLAEINWGSASGAPRFSLWEEEDVDKDQAERDVNLTSALEKSGLKLSRSYYIRTYNLEEGDVEDKPAPTAPTAQPAPAPPAQFSEQPTGDPSVLLADKLGQDAMAASDPWIDQMRQLTMTAASLEDLRDRIINLYGSMDPVELGGIIARAMTLADYAGRSDVLDGN